MENDELPKLGLVIPAVAMTATVVETRTPRLRKDRNSIRWAMVPLIFLAVAFFTPSGLLAVLGRGYLPNRIGIASGVTLGLAVSVDGMVAPVLGVLADRQGVEAVMLVVEAVLVVAVVLSFFLPEAPRSHLQRPDEI